ncbi:LacI family DNA-binding transcriptional regulator [Algibacillus agarilyticus]|uniref:LacI family DNA-binding transcriptional regulator n=1 Tax=Algibacillus agarilyticus TaxID=2234133 RepID=UPI000DCFEC9F|nr:LacI family DNA-binding transcriptional regulator [Algibacillus agarilyticus]
MSNLRIKDIAQRAGVCQATVSRTLRNPDIVSPKTRKKVMAVVDELGFTPNKLGASLRNGRSGNIVVITPDITNPYFSPIVRSIEKVAMAKGYSVLLGDTQEDPSREFQFGDLLMSSQADGIIISSQRLPFNTKVHKNIINNLPPIVSTAEVVEHADIPKVVVDNVAIAETAVQHLIDQGHTTIAAIAGIESHRSTVQRLQGMKNVLSAAGLPFEEKLVYYGNYTTESGVAGVKKLLQQRQRPTALFCFGDMMAIGAMHALRELDFSIPDDISVIGIDDILFAQYCYPPLTSVAQPLSTIGETCANTLIDLIEGRTPEKQLNIMPHKLMQRGSTKAPR